MKKLIRILFALLVALIQQLLVIIIGLWVRGTDDPEIAYFVWCLCFPMFYMNYLTYKNIMEHGISGFWSKSEGTRPLFKKKN